MASQEGDRALPRLVNKLPSYRKHKATGQAVVSLGGRDIYLGPWKSVASKSEYQRSIREWQAGGGANTSDVSGLTVQAGGDSGFGTDAFGAMSGGGMGPGMGGGTVTAPDPSLRAMAGQRSAVFA